MFKLLQAMAKHLLHISPCTAFFFVTFFILFKITYKQTNKKNMLPPTLPIPLVTENQLLSPTPPQLPNPL